ncbi:hypothetical protein [Wohlfahrtiimonas larvae]|nr:hypothetical protein [Wohlfahrtiimonas larvae]
MTNKDIFDDLCDIAEFKHEILQVRMLIRMSDEEFDFFSSQISRIVRNVPVTAIEIAHIIIGGAMRGFKLNELPAFLKFTVNVMFALNDNVDIAAECTDTLTNASYETWEFDQDIVDSTNSVLRSIVYLTNVINGNIIFVK